MRLSFWWYGVWYLLVVVLLVSLLFELLFRPVFSLLFFARLFLVVAALLGSFFVFGEHGRKQSAHHSDFERLRRGLLGEIKKQGIEIKRLKDERQIFLNTSVKQATRTVEVSQSMHLLKKENDLIQKNQTLNPQPIKNRKP